MITKIPYGRSHVDCDIPDTECLGILESKLHTMHSDGKETEKVAEALDNPIGAERLEDWAKNKKNVLIITSDHTRPVPSRVCMPLILERLRKNNPDVDIKIIIATGVHRETTEAELSEKFGAELYAKEKKNIFIHDAFKSPLISLGTLPSGCELTVNAMVKDADGVIAEGFIEPHFFAGFSGGRKSVLPGISSASSVMQNHCAKLVGHPNSRTGILEGNPLHEDMVYASKLCKLEYIVNVVIDGEKKVVKCFAGHPQKAHEKGCEFVSEYCRVAPAYADIVLTSNGGYPLDQNVYQSIKSMTAAEASVNEGGVIICVSKCNDGCGGDELYKWFAEHRDAKEVADIIKATKPKDTVGDQWMAQILSRIMLKASVIMVTDKCSKDIVEGMKMHWCEDIPSAIAKAKEIKPDHNGITVIPDGISVIVK